MRCLVSLVSVIAAMVLGLATPNVWLAAGAQEATPTPEIMFVSGVAVEGLGYGTVPQAPAGPVQLALFRVRLEPEGGRIVVPADDPGIVIHYVETGTVTVRYSVPVMVLRRAAIEAAIATMIAGYPVGTPTMITPVAPAQEQIPADTEFTLAVGDSFAAPSLSGGEYRNDGTEVATLLFGSVVPVAAATPTP